MTPLDWLALMVVGLFFWWVFVDYVAVPLFERICFWFIERQHGKEFAEAVRRRLREGGK
jgi:1,4-dihydroxy-2-naphthoate octaprenyltransferase